MKYLLSEYTLTCSRYHFFMHHAAVPSGDLRAIVLLNTELHDSARAYSDGLASNFLLL
jgi:hypothetical protein